MPPVIQRSRKLHIIIFNLKQFEKQIKRVVVVVIVLNCRLVEEGVLKPDAVENIVAKHNGELSRAFQAADTYSPAANAQYSQVGEAQSKLLKVLTFKILL